MDRCVVEQCQQQQQLKPTAAAESTGGAANRRRRRPDWGLFQQQSWQWAAATAAAVVSTARKGALSIERGGGVFFSLNYDGRCLAPFDPPTLPNAAGPRRPMRRFGAAARAERKKKDLAVRMETN